MATMTSGFSARTLFFHGLPSSKILSSDALSVEDAIRESGLDWNVTLEPVQQLLRDGTYRAVDGKFLTVREDTQKALGTVGNVYRPMQNVDAFTFANELLNYGAVFDAAGAYNNDRDVFLTAKLPESIVLDIEGQEDRLDLYLLMKNNHGGTGAITAMVTPLRINCTNQLGSALRQSKSVWTCRHTSSAAEKVEEAGRTLQLVDKYTKEFTETANELVSAQMNLDEFNGFIADLTESPRLQNGMRTNWLTSETHNRSNRWDALNSVTEYVEHQRGGRGTAESRFASNLDGQGYALRNKAMRLLTVR